jgi:hypothetical protein
MAGSRSGYNSFVSISPISTSTTISETYGSGGVFGVPTAQQVAYIVANTNPDTVTSVSKVSAVSPDAPERDVRGQLVDRYA